MLLRSESIERILQLTGHLALDIGLYPLLCMHTHPPPTSWALSLVWVTCPTSPDRPPLQGFPPLRARPLQSLNSSGLAGDFSSVLGPPWTSPQLHTDTLRAGTGPAGERERKDGGHNLKIFSSFPKWEHKLISGTETRSNRAHLDVCSPRPWLHLGSKLRQDDRRGDTGATGDPALKIWLEDEEGNFCR